MKVKIDVLVAAGTERAVPRRVALVGLVAEHLPQASVAHVQEAGTVEAQDLSAVLGNDDPWAAILEISEENVWGKESAHLHTFHLVVRYVTLR